MLYLQTSFIHHDSNWSNEIITLYLCETKFKFLSNVNVLINKLLNAKLDDCKHISMHNNLNISSAISNIDCSSLIKWTWEANDYGKKGI